MVLEAGNRMSRSRSKMYQCTLAKLEPTEAWYNAQDVRRFIVKERLARNWSQSDLAHFLGVSQSTVSRLEKDGGLTCNFGWVLEAASRLGYDAHVVFLKKTVAEG